MIIILKIILGFFIVTGIFLLKTMIKDYRTTIKTEHYENTTIFNKLKIKIILYLILTTISVFIILLVFFIFSPIQFV